MYTKKPKYVIYRYPSLHGDAKKFNSKIKAWVYVQMQVLKGYSCDLEDEKNGVCYTDWG